MSLSCTSALSVEVPLAYSCTPSAPGEVIVLPVTRASRVPLPLTKLWLIALETAPVMLLFVTCETTDADPDGLIVIPPPSVAPGDDIVVPSIVTVCDAVDAPPVATWTWSPRLFENAVPWTVRLCEPLPDESTWMPSLPTPARFWFTNSPPVTVAVRAPDAFVTYRPSSALPLTVSLVN